MNNSKLWFKAKRYGYGWTPCSKEGWVVTILYLVNLYIFFRAIEQGSHSSAETYINCLLPFLSLTFFFIVICIFKGEKPRWRWGD